MPRKKVQDITPSKTKKTIRSVSLENRSAPAPASSSSIPPIVPESKKALFPSKPSGEAPASANASYSSAYSSSIHEPKDLSFLSKPSSNYSSPLPHSEGSLFQGKTLRTPPSSFYQMDEPKTAHRAKIFITIAFVLFVGFLSFIAFDKYFFRSTLTVTVKTQTVSLSQSLSADLNTSQEGSLPFEVMTQTKEESTTVPETGSKKVERRASGKITIYNDYSKAPQRLIRNTRFETSSGLIFRIEDSVVVPGQKIDNGVVVSGSIEVTVNADAAGNEYNIGTTKFTIPGFKGDPRYGKFSAKSSGAMTGGFVGMVKTASPQDIAKAEGDLKQKLSAELLEASKIDRPKNFISFEKGQFLTFETISPPESNEIKIQGTLHSILFDRTTLSNYVGGKTISDLEEGASLGILNAETLLFEPDPAEIIPWKTGHLPFTLSGEALFEWTFSEEALKQDLAGKQKGMSKEVLSAYPGIAKASVSVRPFWKKSFPTKSSSIKIIYEK
ncbi:MAG: hypothetical protein AAB545_02155 [Patescibacteria group bacterium]